MTAPAVALAGLVHRYGDVEALSGVDLVVEGPGVFGFLGVNGAGKSTTMRVLNGFLRPTAGEARLFGVPVVPGFMEVRRRVGYLPQVPAFHDWMTGREVLRFTASLYGLSAREGDRRAQDLLDRLDLGAAARRRVGGYSGGMRQRLGLAQALVADPDLLLLDEPVSALDPVGRLEVLELVAELGRKTTVFMSSHVLADVERVADRVAVLHRGRVAAFEPTRALLERYVRPVVDLVVSGDVEGLEVDLRGLPVVEAVERVALSATTHPPPGAVHLRVRVRDPEAARRLVPRAVAARELALHDLRSAAPTLEEVFVKLVGEEGSP